MNNKKVGILTFHMAHNYGAMLQAYALREKVEKLGYDSEVIDYRLEYIDQWSRIENYNFLIERFGVLKGNLKFIKRLLKFYYNPQNKAMKYHKFMLNDIGISQKCYRDKKELEKLTYDYYICGSDQIWNESLTGEFEDVYFCNFVKNDAIKIAYAASNGRNEIPKELYSKIGKLIKKFDYIGIRENGLSQYINNEYKVKAVNVLDPSLLLKSEEWGKIAVRPKDDKYLLIYAFDEDQLIYDYAKRIAKKRNLKIILLSSKNIDGMINVRNSTGPKEFLGLIKYAEVICTVSFHGTAFSIIFNKEYYCFPHKAYGCRTSSLQSLLGINRDIFSINDKLEPNINYETVNKKLEIEREKSVDFLRGALNEKCL
ncbi:polysaccharide pyruvyl transferase family protein [Pseudobacteroides cellulosolvens]|uniref:Polysaccharide pyruvyl transferase n=1 Tax=Pseudobacteroides cellulosolvens ATCC 35603 = DSM 2933 TaxID=398512 RepID=A0A0L6JM51_9FIRM|nr:polysaccharide pyruvyl transferase family protein [Pseudobacteroides cellulosolvens]KNY26825.1 polysaccharide pyruvyl transferase [Pseudobacteroides cellulosolvens ATCC 35603 = DSM 2933]